MTKFQPNDFYTKHASIATKLISKLHKVCKILHNESKLITKSYSIVKQLAHAPIFFYFLSTDEIRSPKTFIKSAITPFSGMLLAMG